MKIISTFVISLMAFHSVYGCDVCGCAVSSPNGDVLPGIFTNYIGIGTSWRSFSSRHLTLFDDEIPIQSSEHFSLMNLHGRYSPIRRLQFYGNLPFSAVFKTEGDETRYSSGLSDVSVRANYLLIDKVKDSTESFLNLFLGSTLKMPTGRNEFNQDEKYFFHRNMLPGSGTYDIAFHVDFIYRRKSLGFAAYGTAMIRGQLKNDYAFGNFYHSRVSAFHFFKFKQSSLMIDLGVDYSHFQQDRDLRTNALEEYTGGWILSPTFRMNYNWEKFIFSATVQRPAIQQLANNQVSNNYSIQFNVIYLIHSKK